MYLCLSTFGSLGGTRNLTLQFNYQGERQANKYLHPTKTITGAKCHLGGISNGWLFNVELEGLVGRVPLSWELKLLHFGPVSDGSITWIASSLIPICSWIGRMCYNHHGKSTTAAATFENSRQINRNAPLKDEISNFMNWMSMQKHIYLQNFCTAAQNEQNESYKKLL